MFFYGTIFLEHLEGDVGEPYPKRAEADEEDYRKG